MELPATPNILAAMRYLADKKPDRYRIAVSGYGVLFTDLGKYDAYPYIQGREWWALWKRPGKSLERTEVVAMAAEAFGSGYMSINFDRMDGEGI